MNARRALVATLLFVTLTFAGCLGNQRTELGAGDYEATIRWTDYGIPHITADDWGGLGFGYGFAYARDNLCVLAEEIVTVNGERSKFFGPNGPKQVGTQGPPMTNLQSDSFFNLYNQHPELANWSGEYPRPELQDALEGFAAGYNEYLARTPKAEQSIDCRDAAWLRPITKQDLVRRTHKLQLFASSYQFAIGMYESQPPLPDALPQELPREMDAESIPEPTRLGLGSNGYAFGREMTADGHGMLLGNPHFPWRGPERFHEVHFTIPGKVDVMGMALHGLPVIAIGFTPYAAWTHTVSTAWRFSLYELKLVPGDPTSYLYEGQPRQMTTYDVTVDLGDGKSSQHTYYFSHHGPIMALDAASQAPGTQGLQWDSVRAYAIRDANLHNDRIVEQFYRFNTASSFDEFKQSLYDVHGVPWVNTIAASPDGRALYADVSITPNISNAQIADCNTAVGRGLFQLARLPVLDGSRRACEWTDDPRAAQTGIMPAEDMPSVERDDYVINSNDSHWLPNPRSPLEGYSAIIGPERTERSPRTRMGFVQLEERLAGDADCSRDPEVECNLMTLGRLQDTLYADRLMVPELVRHDLVAQACQGPPMVLTSAGRTANIGEACRVLQDWDLRGKVDSVGTPLFELFWAAAPRQWLVPFSAADPVGTPNTYAAALPQVREALATAVLRMTDAGIPIDAANGEARYVTRNGERIPLHGAHNDLGAPSMMIIPFEDGKGWGEGIHGNSYIQTVTWDDAGPVAEAILTYSQSTDPSSPHYDDQTWLYSRGGWVSLPFHDEDVQERTVETLRLA